MNTMSKKDERENKNNNSNTTTATTKVPAASSKPTAYAGPDQIVYEGSEVKLDGSSSFAQNNNKTLSSYSWRQVARPEVKLDSKNIKTPSFKAPYIDLDFNTPGQKSLMLI